MDEATFLDRQAAEALADLRRTGRMMAQDVKTAISLSGWTREFPWTMIASSALASLGAGFGLGAAIWKKSQDAGSMGFKRPQSQEEPSLSQASVPNPNPNPIPNTTKIAKKRSLILSLVLRIAGFLAKAALRTIVQAKVSPPPVAAGPSLVPSTNGRRA